MENKELGLIAYLMSHVEYFSPNFNLIKKINFYLFANIWGLKCL